MKHLFLVIFSLCFFCLTLNAATVKAAPLCPRIISLDGAYTEVLIELGAKDCIIGISSDDEYSSPKTKNWKPKKFAVTDDLGKFIKAKPDLILARPRHMALADQLMDNLKISGIKIYSAQVIKAGDLYNHWREVAALVGRQAEAEQMIADFDRQVSAYYEVASQLAEENKPGVFFETIHGQIKTFSPDSLPCWILGLAGGQNIASDAKSIAPSLIIADYGPERIKGKIKQIDLIISPVDQLNDVSIDQIKKRNIYKNSNAVKNGNIFNIPSKFITSPAPSSLLLGLKQIAEWTGLKVNENSETNIKYQTESLNSTSLIDSNTQSKNVSLPVKDEIETLDLKVDLPPIQGLSK